MCRIAVIFLFYVWCVLPIMADSDADRLLNRVVEWTSAKKTLEVDYTLTAADERVPGTLVIDGHRFKINSDVMDTWYDGKTQWSYSPATGEVTITEPTEEEIQQVNPFAIIDTFRRNYTAGMKPMNRNSTHHVIVMTPTDRGSDITRVEISVPVGQFYPARIVIWVGSGETLAIDTVRLIRGNSYSASDFTYTPSAHPDAEIVDLR